MGHVMCNLMEWRQVYKMLHVAFHKSLHLAQNGFLWILMIFAMYKHA